MPLRLPTVLRLGLPGLRRLRARLGEADRAMAAGDWASAEAGYAAVLAIDPHRWPLHVQRGHALKEQGFLRRAEAAYRQALAADAGVGDTHLQLGHVLKLQGRTEAARAAYRTADRLAPGHAEIARELAGIDEAVPRADPALPEGIAALLTAADLTPAFLPLFDEVFYVAANPLARRDLPAPNRPLCIEHFCEVGLAAVLPFDADRVFDPAFYRATALGGRAVSDAAAYRHWLNLGLAQGRAANPMDRLARATGIGRRSAAMLPPLALDAFSALADGGDAIDRFDEMRAAGALSEGAPGRAVLLAAFGDHAAHLAGGGRARQAVGSRLDARLLTLAPDDAGALGRTAERLHREGFSQEAQPHFAALMRGEARSVGAALGLAACLEAGGSPETALDVLAAGRRLFAGDTRLDHAFDAVAERLLHRAFRLALASGGTGAVEEADAALTQAVAHVVGLVGDEAARPPPRPIRSIAIVGDGDLPQCRFYRIDGKLEQLAALGVEAAFFDHRTGIPAFLGTLHRFDAVVFYRVPASHPVITAIMRSRALGLPTIYETDDLIFDAAHYPDDLASYGGAIDAREHLGLRLGVPLMAAAMSLCDVGLASTPALAAAMAPLVRSGRTFVHPNALGGAHAVAAALPRPPRNTARVTIIYGSGTKAHAADFSALVAPALVTLVQIHGEAIRIVLVGHVPTSDGLETIAANVTRHPTLPLDAFWSLLGDADIALAVLKPSTMADAKSAIKWLEAAMLGVPSVVSDTAAMREAVTPGEDGFLCATPQDWLATLDRLVRDGGLRRAIGMRAQAKAAALYGPAAAVANLGAILRALAPPPTPQKPRLLVVNVYYPPQNIGGATRVVHDNVRWLIADGHYDVSVFTTTDGGGAPYTLSTHVEDGIRVTAATIPARPDIDRWLDDPAMGAAFAGFLADERPDLIHFHCVQRLTIAAVDAARAAGIPYLVTAHDGWWVSDEQFVVDRFGTPMLYAYDDPADTQRRLGAAAAKRMARLRPALLGAVQVLAVSEPFADLHRGCGVRNVVAVPNGLSTAMAAVRLPASTRRLRLGFVGGMHHHKGWGLVETALTDEGLGEAFELLVVDHALPAGTTGAARFGTTPVTFVPRVPPARVAELYGRIDILLAPSIWPESFGLVVREALACGCWVIASDRGAIGADVVPGANGFVVSVAGPDALAAALRAIAAAPDRYRGPPDHRPAQRMADDQGRDLAALYAALLDGAPHPPRHDPGA